MDYRLGKAPRQLDERNIPARMLFKAGLIPAAPEAFSVDEVLNTAIDNPVYRNAGDGALGDCVIAARAHMTRRFECFEQKALLNISDDDVVREYFREQGYPAKCWLLRLFQQGPPDNGLGMLNSLKSWRTEGWTAAGQKYDIHAFAALDWKDAAEVRAGIYYLSGAYVGIKLPNSARAQVSGFWEVDDSPNGTPGTWGLHCVYVKAYGADGLTCITWGSEQRMTWAFWNTYIDEAYAIVDARDKFLKDSPVDIVALENILQEVTK